MFIPLSPSPSLARTVYELQFNLGNARQLFPVAKRFGPIMQMSGTSNVCGEYRSVGGAEGPSLGLGRRSGETPPTPPTPGALGVVDGEIRGPATPWVCPLRLWILPGPLLLPWLPPSCLPPSPPPRPSPWTTVWMPISTHHFPLPFSFWSIILHFSVLQSLSCKSSLPQDAAKLIETALQERQPPT